MCTLTRDCNRNTGVVQNKFSKRHAFKNRIPFHFVWFKYFCACVKIAFAAMELLISFECETQDGRCPKIIDPFHHQISTYVHNSLRPNPARRTTRGVNTTWLLSYGVAMKTKLTHLHEGMEAASAKVTQMSSTWETIARCQWQRDK